MHTTDSSIESNNAHGRNYLYRCLLSLTIVALPAAGSHVHARGGWDVSPSVALTTSYTDNVALDPPGRERGDFIQQINPGFAATLETPRANVAADYRMQNIFYANNTASNSTFHQLQLDGNAELVTEKAFVDGGMSLGQNLTDPSQPASSNLTVSESIQNVFSYYVSPYYRDVVTDNATGELRYTFGEVTFTDTNESSTLHSVSGILATDDRNRRTSWQTTFDSSYVDYDSGEEVRANQVEFEARHALSSTLRVFGVIGYEQTEINDPAATEPEGAIYRVGVAWAASPRTNMELAVGENAFGSGGAARISHQTSRTYMQAEYSEEVTTITEQLLIDRVFDRVDPLGNPVERGELTAGGVVVPGVVTDPFIEKAANLTFAVDTASTLTTLNAFHVERDFLVQNLRERFYGGSLSWGWSIGAKTSAEVYATYRWEDLTTGVPGDETYEWGIVGVRDIRPTLRGTVSFRRFRNDTDVEERLARGLPERESRENVVSFTLEKIF